MTHKVTLIPGDGIGPEVIQAARKCIEATGLSLEWEEAIAGREAEEKYGQLLPKSTLDSIRRNKVALKGPIITPVAFGFRSVNVGLRQALNLYACLRPAKSYPGIKSKAGDIDLVIIRENTEDLYAGIEFPVDDAKTKKIIKIVKNYTHKEILSDSAISLKPISKTASQRIVRFAFEYALNNKRKKVTVVHKANIMKFTDGLFLNIARQLSNEYVPKIAFEERIVDNMAMQLVQKPQDYDILVLPNLYGDIISDLCAGLVGGLGVAPGANIGDDIAVFEAVHGAAPKYKGKNKVNPTAMILSGIMMLKYLKEELAAERLQKALTQVLSEGKYVTYDLKPNRDDPTAVGTQEMADAVIEKLHS